MKKIKGNNERPRLAVYRSNKHIYAQLINDREEKVLFGISSLSPQIKKKALKESKKVSREIGKVAAEQALKRKIKKVVFDKGKFKYHGKVKEIAEGAREGGLDF